MDPALKTGACLTDMEQGMISAAVELVRSLGAPLVFCGWLMWRVEKRLDKQTELLEKIVESMTSILEHFRKEEHRA